MNNPKINATIMENNLWTPTEEPSLSVSEIKIMYSPPVKASQRIGINGSADAEKLLRKVWSIPLDLRECFYALFLNRANKVLGYYLVSIGGLTGTVADVRTIFQAALKANACSIILAHNHPSGNGLPSQADIQLTERMKGAGLIMEIPLIDHIILLSEGHYSMADNGLL